MESLHPNGSSSPKRRRKSEVLGAAGATKGSTEDHLLMRKSVPETSLPPLPVSLHTFTTASARQLQPHNVRHSVPFDPR